LSESLIIRKLEESCWKI